MGLNDSFKQTNSTGVSQFAGSMVPEMRETKRQLEDDYYKSRDMALSMQELLSTVKVAPNDEAALESLTNEVNTQVSAIAEGGRWEKALPDLYTTSSRTTQKLKQLAGRAATRENYQDKELADPKLALPKLVQDYLKETTDRDNAPATFDKHGRVPSYTTKKAVPQVDNNKLVHDAVLSVVKANGVAFTSDTDPIEIVKENDKYRVKQGESVTEISADALQQTLDYAMANSQEWQESVDQEAAAKAYHSVKGIDDRTLEEKLANPSSEIDFVAIGKLNSGEASTPREALELTYKEQFVAEKQSDLRNYSRMGASKNVSGSRETGPSHGKTEQEQKDAAAARAAVDKEIAEDNKIVATGATTIVDPNSNPFENSTANGTSIASLDQSIANKKKYAENLAKDPKATIAQKATVQAEILENEAQKQRLLDLQNAANKQKGDLLEKAAATKNMTKSQFLAQDREALWKGIKNQTFTTDEGYKVPAIAVLRAYDAGGISVNEYQGRATPTSVVVLPNHEDIPTTLRGKTVRIKDADLTGSSTRYKELEGIAKKMAKDGTSVVTTTVPITEKIKPQVKDIAPGLTMYDVSGKQRITDYTDVDWSKTEVGAWLPEVDMIQMTIMKDGSPVQVLADAKNTSYFKLGSGELKLQGTPALKSFGKLRSHPDYNAAVKLLANATGEVSSLKGKELADREGNPIGIIKTGYGTYAAINSLTGQFMKDETGSPLVGKNLNEAVYILLNNFVK